jgi:alpha-tubulin suppressor-like RCC1 family protein
MAAALLSLCAAASLAHDLECADLEHLCFLWANTAECEYNNAFMQTRCAASCGLCDTGSHEAESGDPASAHVVMLSHTAEERLPFAVPSNVSVEEIEAGELHLVLRLSSGEVFTFGDDSVGQLGQARIAQRTMHTRRSPARVYWPGPLTHLPAVAVAAGRMHSGALLADGSLVLWGENARSQCGIRSDLTAMDASPVELVALSTVAAVPTRVPLSKPVKDFSLGEVHSLVLTVDGEVLSFGDPSFGATCNSTDPDADADAVIVPCRLPLRDGEVVTSVNAGGFHSMVVTSHGRVLVWGDNSHGQLGSERKDGFVYSMLQDAQSGVGTADEADLDRELDAAFQIGELNLPLQSGERLEALSTRSFHSAVLTDHGRLFLFGDNAYGQLGVEPANESAVGDSQAGVPLGPASQTFAARVSLGELHTLALDNESRPYSFGLNTRFQLGRMHGATWDAYPDPVRLPLEDGEDISILAAGAHFSAAATNRANLYVWGEALLAADTRARSSHELDQSAAAAATAGHPNARQGIDEEAWREVLFTTAGASSAPITVCAGAFHFLAHVLGDEAGARNADGQVVSWGENAASQLCRRTEDDIADDAAPLDPPPAMQPASAEGKLVLGCGAFHSLLSIPGEGVFICGTPTELPPPTAGDATAPPPPPLRPAAASPPRVGTAAERQSSGTAAPAAAPAGTSFKAHALTRVPLPSSWDPSDPIVSLAAGHAHSIAVSRAGRVFTWGSNEFGQLGRGPLPHLGAPDAAAALPPAEVRLVPPGPAPTAPSTVPVRLVAAGGYHNVLVTWSGEAWSFGSNSHGQLARRALPESMQAVPRQVQMPPSHRGQSVIAAVVGLRHSALLLSSGAVCTFGDHGHGQLGRELPDRANTCDVVEGLPAVQSLAAGELHMIALTEDGELWSWGDNQFRQCARELQQPMLPVPGRVALPLDEDESVAQISAAGYHSIITTSTGRCFTLGGGLDGGLGMGHEYHDDEQVEYGGVEHGVEDEQDMEEEHRVDGGAYYDER